MARNTARQPRAIVELISNTTTKTGLTVRCEFDTAAYPKCIKVSDQQMETLNLTIDTFQSEWNFTTRPRPSQIMQ